ncbi:MAG: InlB B-repeat-containing protein, partial [Clostridia bacterium]|nr:InlB B-repeat-containing protein [Clostridia bacterium]
MKRTALTIIILAILVATCLVFTACVNTETPPVTDGDGTGVSPAPDQGGNNGGADDSVIGPGGGETPQPPETKPSGLVCFDANGGEVSVAQKQYEVGALMIDMPIPTRDGYDFVAWKTDDGKSYTSASVMPDLDGETLYLYAEWKKQVSVYSDEYVQFSPAVEGIKNDDDFYLYYANKVDEYIYVELDIDYVGYGNAGNENNFRLGNWENLMFNTKDGCSLTWYTDSDFSRINGAQMFTLNYGSNIQFLTVSYQGIVRKTYLVDFYLLRDYYISLCDSIYDEPYTKVRIDEGETFDKNYEWRWTDTFEAQDRVYYNYSTGNFEVFDYSTIINHDWILYQTYALKTITYLDANNESQTLSVKPFEYVTLPIPSKDGYTFIGWQQPDKKMFTNIAGRTRLRLTVDNYFETLTPIWRENVFEKIDTVDSTEFKIVKPSIVYDNSGELYKLEYYTLNNEICYVEQSDVPESTKTNKAYFCGDEVTLVAMENPGYTWIGWYDDSTNGYNASVGTSNVAMRGCLSFLTETNGIYGGNQQL